MSQQHNSRQLPAPCIIESGIIVNKEDMKRLLNDLTHVRYIHKIDGVIQNQGRGVVLEVFNEPNQATIVVNKSLYINVQSFDYLYLNQVSPEETYFDLIQENRTLTLIPMPSESREHQVCRNLGFDNIEEMLGEVFSAKWDMPPDEDF
ncbi:MAG: hypothetical protein NZ901_02205 [Geminocystis sp.]|nr:hypothetical protein [Geminocystis sp.]HIK37881.1 hypothetical protein [Geminocystis sp. M7585_C2015_104]MCS7146982.1 hypothetical protein [Geminocystis sp.]MCX8077294.1 hypothetical protein [Geminocystis sp.]MDW8115806.1 hypothetical protein [Geminocystis sp.]